jgi:hypothetical protein
MTTVEGRTDSAGRYLGDRYERLRSGSEQIASDQNIVDAESIFSVRRGCAPSRRA